MHEELLAIERGLVTGQARKGQLYLVLVLVGVFAVLGSAGVAAWRFWPRSIAKGVPRTVLVADFDNRTGEDVFNGTLEPAMGLALEGATFINSYSRASAQKLADRLKLEGTGLSEKRARLVAQREGLGVVVAGFVDRDGAGYQVGARAVDAFTGQKIVEGVEAAPGKGGPVGRLEAGGQGPRRARRRHAARAPAEGGRDLQRRLPRGGPRLQRGQRPGGHPRQVRRGREALPGGHPARPGLGRAYSGLAVIEANRGHGADAAEALPGGDGP